MGDAGDTAQYNHRGGYSSNPSSSSPSLSSSVQSTSAEDGSAAADLVVFPCLHNDDTDEHSKEHGQNQHAGHFPLLSHKVCEETRVWTMNAEMVQRSTLVSVNIDIMCRAIKQPMMEESNVLVQAMLGEDSQTVARVPFIYGLNCYRYRSSVCLLTDVNIMGCRCIAHLR